MLILVTGGAGFLGSHLCDRLIENGHDVICVDNLQTGSIANIEHLLEHPRFIFRQQDITEPLSLRVDQIYNLACPASPRHYQADPIRTLKTSVIGSLNLLELARKTNAKILQASTSEIYGDPDVHPQPETYTGNVNPIGLRACYDEGKRAAETLFFDYNRQHGVQIKVARIFNTYGPRMAVDDGRVVSNFIVQALRGEAITLYGNGQQTRSFCYVDDLIAGLIALMNTDDQIVGPVNLGNPDEFTIKELADKVQELVGWTPIEYLPLPADDPEQRQPDITLAATWLGWKPSVKLKQGLAHTVHYFESVLDIAKDKQHG